MVNNKDIRFVSQKAWDRIETWSWRKPVFALMGEFSAGKSTLMNFLLRQQALPTQVTATQLPPVWFSYGDDTASLMRHDGSIEPIDLHDLDKVGVNDAQFIRIHLNADILEAVDLIDTPGISDPKISTDVWRRAVGQANGVLWCTHSTQAWRESERATWAAMPERLQNNSLLLVTRADALGPKDRQKVLRRVNREAGHLFNRSILFSARDAITARDKTGDPELWARSGGNKMVDSFLEITEQIMEARTEQLSRYKVADKGSDAMDAISPARVKTGIDVASSEPLKLERPIAAEDSDGVVTNFPIRPNRVERRHDEAERPRIEAEEAEKLRAEMLPEQVLDQAAEDENSEENLRAFFRDSAAENIDLDSLPQDQELDDIHGMEDVNSLETLSTTSTDDNDNAESILSAVSTSLSETVEPVDPASGEIVRIDEQDTGRVLVEAEAPQTNRTNMILSAATKWREITTEDDLPDDVAGLKRVFAEFLEDFDETAAKHYERRTKEALRATS